MYWKRAGWVNSAFDVEASGCQMPADKCRRRGISFVQWTSPLALVQIAIAGSRFIQPLEQGFDKFVGNKRGEVLGLFADAEEFHR